MSVEAPHRSTITVVGMSCEHCVRAVTAELEALSGVRTVEVALGSGVVTVTSERELSGTELAGAVEEAGYQLAG